MTGISKLWADNLFIANKFYLQISLVGNASSSMEFGDGPVLLLNVQK